MKVAPSPPTKQNQNPFFLAAGDIQKKGSYATKSKRAAGLSPPSIVPSGKSNWERSKSGDGAGGPSFNKQVEEKKISDAVIEKQYCERSLGLFHINNRLVKNEAR